MPSASLVDPQSQLADEVERRFGPKAVVRDPAELEPWLTDWRGYRDFNAAYGEFVEPPYPPRATVLAGLVPPSAQVQIEAIAHRAGGEATVLDATAKEARG